MPGPRRFAAPAYGLRTRLKVIRQEGRDDPELRRWYPVRRLLDPFAFLDLTTPWEQAWLARELATRRPTGAVVELGPWLGASSAAIVRGLRRSGRTDGFDTYDTFRFTDIEARALGTPLEGTMRDGDSFRPIFEARLGPAVASVRIHEGDVCDATWSDGPIQLLFVDLAKTWDTWRHIRRAFLPHLQVGGLIVQQDWGHANAPWLILWHHRWREHFEALDPIAYSSTVAFELRAPLPDAAFGPDVLADYSRAEVVEAFRWAATLVHPSMAVNVAAAEVMLHALHGELPDGVDALMAAAREAPIAGELASVAIPELARRLAAGPG